MANLHVVSKRHTKELSRAKWNWDKFLGDKEFIELKSILPYETSHTMVYEMLWRPKNFKKWKDIVLEELLKRPTEIPFQPRHLKLLDILNYDDDLWIYEK